MEPVKVVIRYAHGGLIKGFTNDFFPNKPFFHVRPIESGSIDKGVEIHMKELKAVFFVKDFKGNREYHERKHFADGQQANGRRVEVTFLDGEVMVGSTLGYDPSRPGFFVTPADTDVNNIRVFVVSTAVSKFRFVQTTC
ncbi:MAG TPA: hypothetical protein VEI96_04360 [Thermodesulfovibrionales bacterium]|nr:hypothetical protein [Thermodesulfovibrionales bacterium]